MTVPSLFVFAHTVSMQQIIAALEQDSAKIVCSYSEGGLSFILKTEGAELKAVLFFDLERGPLYVLATAQKEELLELLRVRQELNVTYGVFESFVWKKSGNLATERHAHAASRFIDHVWIGISTS